jgi:rare lipoprotein A
MRGDASWYGPGFHGKKTASGEIYDQTKLTAAHKTLPLGSKARVTNLENGSTVEVQINDRGPFIEGRIIDLSRAAAWALGFVEAGIVPVRVEIVESSSRQ